MITKQSEMTPRVSIILTIDINLYMSDIKKTKQKLSKSGRPDWTDTHLGWLDDSEKCIHDIMKKALYYSIKNVEVSKDEVFFTKYDESSSNNKICFDIFFNKAASHLFDDFFENFLRGINYFRRWVKVTIKDFDVNGLELHS